MQDAEAYYKQEQNIKYVSDSYGKESWVRVSGKDILNRAEAHFWCALIKKTKVKSVFRDFSWDTDGMSDGPGFEGGGSTYTYKRNLVTGGIEPLLYYRNFYGVIPDCVELAQEFILLNNLYYDSIKHSYFELCMDGETEEAVRYQKDNCTVSVKLKYLQKYAAAKQMAILLFFDIRTEIEGSLEENGLDKFFDTFKDKDLYYSIWGDQMDFGNKHVYSVLMGKKILYPNAVDQCGYWPYENKEKYETFIIGTDEFGNTKEYTCNPSKLANNFGTNADAPYYFTLVFFKKEVLQKYILKPELYTITDGSLQCQVLWQLQIDNHHKDCVIAYLGDLGKNLPESERLYWKSYNIDSDEKLSRVTFERDFMCLPSESNMIDHKFQRDYAKVIDYWNKKYGWSIFLSLTEQDEYNLSQIRIPLTNSQPEFDMLVLSLVKVLIDSLNEAKLKETLTKECKNGSINELQGWLEEHNCQDYEIHIKFLREVQELRSTGTGHRKGTNYNKTARKFDVGIKTLKDVFENILEKADEFLLYLMKI